MGCGGSGPEPRREYTPARDAPEGGESEVSDFLDSDEPRKPRSSELDQEKLAALEEQGESAHKIITARGTEEGLVLRIDGRSEWPDIIEELVVFLGQRRRFLEGGEIALEWLDRLPTKEQSQELEIMLRQEYDIEIIGRRGREPKKSPRKRMEKLVEVGRFQFDEHTPKRGGGTIPLFDDLELSSLTAAKPETLRRSSEMHKAASKAGSKKSDVASNIEVSLVDDDMDIHETDRQQLRRVNELLGEESFADEEPNARVIYGTLRSGQRIETPFSLVVVGDVNPGADLVAGGDIIVFGSLRGTAHACAYDDDCQDRVIIALQMQPMQLRIGSVISRGNGEAVRGAEIARIEDRRIIVEAYNPRAVGAKRLR